MTTPTTVRRPRWPWLSGLVDTRRVPKPSLARIVLTATGLVVALVLLLWLLLWINPIRRGIAGRWIAQRSLGRPWIAHQAADLEKVLGAPKGGAPESDYANFRDLLRDHLTKAGNRPVTLYVSAAGVVDDEGAVLLRDDTGTLAGAVDTPGGRSAVIRLEDLLAVLKEAGQRFPAQSRFLIWDAGQVGSDRNLGVYGNGFVKRLQAALAEAPPRRLAVLCSCGPGQTSWSSELDGRSVFGYFVEQGLAGKAAGPGALTVRSLSQYVRAQVAQWVRDHRQAEQTPVLLGDDSVDFLLPRPKRAPRPAREAAADPEAKRLLQRLERAWAARDQWQARKPYRYAPRAWLRYLETLLRAERLFRDGEYAEAEQVLGGLPNLANDLARLPRPENSLALLERLVADGGDPAKAKELADARKDVEQALERLLGEDEPAAAAGEADAEGKPAPAKKEGEADTPAAKAADVAKPAEPAEKAKTKTSSALSSGRLARKADSPLLRLIASKEDQYPKYPEAQLLVWANTFVTRGPERDAFRGRRGEALVEAMTTRALAEEAAASDERISRWVRPWVEAGDRARRKAQDLLFASDPATAAPLEALEEARQAYQAAKNHAETCERAVDLGAQLAAEMPFYGEWKARRAGRIEVGLDPSAQALLDAAAELGRLVDAGPPAPRGDEDPRPAIEEKIQVLRAQHDKVAEALQGLTEDFRNQWESSRWRDLDAALRVPLVPAEARMKMLERVRSRAVASTLSGSVAVASSEPSASAGASGADPEAKSEAAAAEGAAASSAASALGFSTPDPSFLRQASGLARLEVGLLELGAARPEDLATLKDAYERASRTMSSDPFADFADFSARVRKLRRARLAALPEKPDPDRRYDDLVDDDRAARVMPLADSSARVDRVVESLARFHRRDLAIWHAHRLLDDFAPGHALAVLDDARERFGDASSLRDAAEKARLASRARLVVETGMPRQATIDEQQGMPLTVRVKAEGDVPPGEAVAFVAYDRQLPVSVHEKSPKADPAAGTLVAVASASPAEPVEFVVERADSTPSSVSVRLQPGAFYRGRIFPKDLSASGVEVRLDPAKEGIEVALRQSDRGLIKKYGDQFERHPGQGFLHPHTPLAFRLVISHQFTRPTKVWLRYGFEGKPETIVTKPDVRLEPGRANEDIRDRADTDLHEIPVEKPRYLVLEIRKDNEAGRVLLSRRYPFRQVLPTEYMRVQDGFDEATKMAFVNVWHLKSDPVNGPSDVTVMLAGQSLSRSLDRGEAEQWWRYFTQTPPPVPWQITVEKVPNAFRGNVETGVVPPQEKKEAPAQ